MHLFHDGLAGSHRVAPRLLPWLRTVSVLASQYGLEHTNRGLSIDEVIARTWKAQEAAPALCTPMFGGPLAYWKDAFALSERLLDALTPTLEGLDVENVISPHFISGPLDLGQRLEFLHFHMDRHLGQIERVKQAPGFYSSAAQSRGAEATALSYEGPHFDD